MKIGIIKEGKVPVDHRVPFTPVQCRQIMDDFPNMEIYVQPSDIRSYADEEYEAQGITLEEDLSDCDVLFGVKEVNKEDLIPYKQYFFFSHTIKKQPYNQSLLQEVLKKNITLTDYECLKNTKGTRVVAFGKFAGIVGAYNALWAYGNKHDLYHLKRAYQCKGITELYGELNKITSTDLKVILTGGGRVANGAKEVLVEAGFMKLDESEFVTHEGNSFLQIDPYDYNKRIDGQDFSYADFFANPSAYEGTFTRFLDKAPIFIAGAYWDPHAPVLFTEEDVKSGKCQFDIISDITCDIKGSVPTTVRSTTIEEPVFDINKSDFSEQVAFSNLDNITVVAVDNLPCELPRDASESFGDQLIENVIPVLAGKKTSDIVKNASITDSKGSLTELFAYLEDYVVG